MKDVFKTQDVFGNNVTCTNSTWYYHIVTNHGIMSKNISAIVDTINDPDYVYEDKDYDSRKNFLKESTKATYSPKFTTKVVIEYDMNDEGSVVTAYPINKNSKGGVGAEIYCKQNGL